ncbi:polysaccharide biosynthesis/export family protein [Pseudacidobacterium ailaaui]|uniref:polysaccharide biosynthesis/export family protein n=1 Tax=Pseudacidobacterium ailaaui TaxID=1382359 RepID=UPI00138DE4C4|nr:polysaccharide biosynthesis/export family protein [Pseudacidobacterium ailaaui]
MGLRTAARRGILLALLFCFSALSARAADKKESLRISSGDLLHVSVFREPDLEQHVRVRDSGEIDLDLVGAVSVVGLVPGEAALKIAQAYEQGKYLNHPQVSVLIEEYATQQVSVLGQVARPGAVPLMTSRSLLDVLSLAGGLTDVADRHITIERGDKSGSLTVFVPNDASTDLKNTVMVHPGDTVLVPKAGVVYVLGDVGRPGGYVMQDDAKLTVLQAIALAAGANRSAKENAARLLRKVQGRYQEQTIPLKDMERGSQPDMELEAGDVLYIPFSMARNVVVGASGILSSTSSAAIYAAR